MGLIATDRVWTLIFVLGSTGFSQTIFWRFLFSMSLLADNLEGAYHLNALVSPRSKTH